jgi:hypothetical protein
MPRAEKFLEQLCNEKEMHKEHRHALVLRKLTFIIGLFGLGTLGFKDISFMPLLFLVPAIALCYDVFIFAEDFKVHRIGKFVRDKARVKDKPLDVAQPFSKVELDWELWLCEADRREPLGYWASLVITCLASGACVAIVWRRTETPNFVKGYLLGVWTIAVLVGIILIFRYCRNLQAKLRSKD